MIDHLNLPVSDYTRSRAFYRAVLATLGFKLLMEGESGAGFGSGAIPMFWIHADVPMPGVHVAFQSADRAGVDAFYAAALSAGGSDHGAPGLRPNYHPNYYGAFVRDPDGYNVEAVCHLPPKP